MSDRVRVAAASEIPVGSSLECVVGDRIVALFHTDDGWFAIDGICAHAGGPVAQGKVSGGIVTCPWHGWQYNLATGHHCLNARIQQTCFQVEVEADEVFISFH